MIVTIDHSPPYYLEETGLFAKLGNVVAVVVGEHVVAQDGIGDLWVGHQVDFQETSLEVGVLWLVLLQGIQEESSQRLDQVALHEHIGNLLDVGKRGVLLDKAGGESNSLFWVGAEDLSNNQGSGKSDG